MQFKPIKQINNAALKLLDAIKEYKTKTSDSKFYKQVFNSSTKQKKLLKKIRDYQSCIFTKT